MKPKHRNRFDGRGWRAVCAGVGALLALPCSACSRCSNQTDTTLTAQSAAPAAASAPAKTPAPAAPSAPATSPQHLACGDAEFFRITPRALEVFEISPQLPPPQIRGSRVARQSTEVPIAEPSNVIRLDDETIVVLAKSEVLHYELGRKENPRYAPLGSDGPLVAWGSAKDARSFHVHAAQEGQIRQYALVPPTREAARPSGPPPLAERPVLPLPDFDGRWLTLLADGEVLYSNTKGLLGTGAKASAGGPRVIPEGRALLFADAAPEGYWWATQGGGLERWALDGNAPTLTTQVPGVVIDTAVDGARLVVLSVELVGQSYRPTLTTFVDGHRSGQLEVAPSPASLGQPKLDVCLIAGRPWAVVGSTQWLQLLDLEGPRLLAEW